MLAEVEREHTEFGIDNSYTDLLDLLNYDFDKSEELGMEIEDYNGAYRVDILRDHKRGIIKRPENLLELLRYLERVCIEVSYGLQLDKHVIHFMIERSCGDSSNNIGVIFLDQKRVVSIHQIYQIERAANSLGIDKIIVIGNNFSIPSKQAVNRLNREIGYERFDLQFIGSLRRKQAGLIY